MAVYRSTLPNYYSDKGGSYVSVGAIVPTLVGTNTDRIENSSAKDPEFDYRGYLYCDGAEYNINDYPNLYQVIGDEYIKTTDVQRNSLVYTYHGQPGSINRTFVDNGNLFIEVYGRSQRKADGSTYYERVIPDGATIEFPELGSWNPGTTIESDGVYRLNYTEQFQSLAQETDTHVYRVLTTNLNTNPGGGGGGGESPGGTVTWQITSSSLINDGSTYLKLPIAHVGTVPEFDPGNLIYPTGYPNYPGAKNDTIALSWGQMSGLPEGAVIDQYEILLEDLSTMGGSRDNPDTSETEVAFVHWHVKNIPATTTFIDVNGTWPSGVTFGDVEQKFTTWGLDSEWYNNGYCGPQPPQGEEHLYRLYVKAYLTDGQSLVEYIDFTFGSGTFIPQLFVKTPWFERNLDVIGGGSGLPGGGGAGATNLEADWTAFDPQDVFASPVTGHPTVRIRKGFQLKDYPYILGKFRVPDYRDRKLIGFGEGVEGAGTPLVESRITMNMGDTGGRWYISRETINTPQEFFEISDVITTGYSNVTTQIEPYLVGEKKYIVGPIQDYIYAKPPSHEHQILHSQPDPSTFATTGGVDNYTTVYIQQRGSVVSFVPEGEEALGHSHGLFGTRPSNSRIATYGNTDGIGSNTTDALGCPQYSITEAPAINISSWTGNGEVITIVATTDHGLAKGDTVVVQGTGNASVDGTYEVLEDGLTSTSINIANTTGGGGADGQIREAAGFFEEQKYTPEPRVYVVDNVTTIGGKVVPGVNVGVGELRLEEIYGPGSHTVPALARTSSFDMQIRAGGGGGGGSSGNGIAGGNTSVSFLVDGVSYTVTANGGAGGRSGNGGGNGGTRGTTVIPGALLNDDRFSINEYLGGSGSNASSGGDGGSAGTIGADGGDGGFDTTTIEGNVTKTYNSDGTFRPGDYIPSDSSVDKVVIGLSGGAGGDGNNNANSGCGAGFRGGYGGNGAYVQGTYSGSTNFTHKIGTKGGNGFNNIGPFPKIAEDTNDNPGQGEVRGGNGGRGARGNGATGGAGGGGSSVRTGVGIIMGAGGGGGGGGSGGGWNGGSAPEDPCWVGGSGVAYNQGGGLRSVSSVGTDQGSAGGTSGCTAGGGGGGGGGFGPAGGGGGGGGGDAGAGHALTGSGDGGFRGRSAVNQNHISSAVETSGSGGKGYVTYKVYYEGEVENDPGGGGGAGAGIGLSFAVNDYINEDISTQLIISVGSGGGGGAGNGNKGADGEVRVEAYEITATEVGEAELTSPKGRYYEVPGMPTNTPDFPDTFSTGNIWHSASSGVNVRSPTGSNFPAATTLSDSKAQRFVEFKGAGSRWLQIGPLNLTFVEKLIFTVIKGNGSNGGDTPEEDFSLFFKTSLDSPSETNLERIAAGGPGGSAGYENYIIELDEENDARKSGIYLVIRQNRPDAAGDNDDVPGGLTNDNWGLAQFGMVYGEVTNNVFVPSSDATLPGNNTGTCGPDAGINVVKRTVTAKDSNIRFTDGLLTLTGSTPVSVTAEARTTEDIPLLTRYHRSKYLIKAF